NGAIRDNQAVGGLGGGGVFNEAGATVTVVNVSFDDNQASVDATADVFGGGLLNAGNAIVSSSSFSNNQVFGGASFSLIGGTAGGGIDNFHGGSLTVTSSTFVNNVSSATAGPYFALGGALDNNSGPNDDAPSTASVTGCVFQ